MRWWRFISMNNITNSGDMHACRKTIGNLKQNIKSFLIVKPPNIKDFYLVPTQCLMRLAITRFGGRYTVIDNLALAFFYSPLYSFIHLIAACANHSVSKSKQGTFNQ